MRSNIVTFVALCAAFCFSAAATAQPYTTTFGAGEIKVDVVKRSSDDTVLVKGTITNTTDGSLYIPTSGLTPLGNFISVRLQDLKTKKQYEQVTVEKTPVGSRHEYIPGGKTTPFWARVTAPPKDVKQVTILFAGDALPIEEATIAD